MEEREKWKIESIRDKVEETFRRIAKVEDLDSRFWRKD
jgi:hypothetical protein